MEGQEGRGAGERKQKRRGEEQRDGEAGEAGGESKEG